MSSILLLLRAAAGAAKVDTLVEYFTTYDSGKWTLSSADATFAGGRGRVVTNTVYPFIESVSKYRLQDSSLSAEVYGDHLLADDVSFGMRDPAAPSTSQVLISLTATTISFQYRTGGVLSETTATYNPVLDRWWRITHVTGTGTTWQTSRDGRNWTVRRTVASGPPVTTDMSVIFAAGNAGGNTGAAYLDNLNVVPAQITGNFLALM